MYSPYEPVYFSSKTSTAQCYTPLFEFENSKFLKNELHSSTPVQNNYVSEKPITLVRACPKQLYFKKRITLNNAIVFNCFNIMETILASNLNNRINIFPRKNENESNPVGRNLRPVGRNTFDNSRNVRMESCRWKYLTK